MGLYDRTYMHDPNRRPDKKVSSGKMLFILILINVIAWILDIKGLALTIQPDGFKFSQLHKVITAGFAHYDFWHLLFNMWGLHLFGSMIIPHINGIKLLILYLSGVIFGNLLFVLFNLQPEYPVSLLGASGAVCAFMAAAATLEPERRLIMIFMPFTPIKTSTMVICYTVMEILFELSGNASNIAHLAHLGGFAGGYLTMLFCFGKKLPWDPFHKITQKFNFSRRERIVRPISPKESSSRSSTARVSQPELDALLDKLSTNGINSLSEYELERLRQARKQMRGEE